MERRGYSAVRPSAGRNGNLTLSAAGEAHRKIHPWGPFPHGGLGGEWPLGLGSAAAAGGATCRAAGAREHVREEDGGQGPLPRLACHEQMSAAAGAYWTEFQ